MANVENDVFYMDLAITLAKKAYDIGEVPVGAVVVKDGEIIGRGYNMRECSGKATAHAEVLAIEDACAKIGSWRLNDCIIYVTMEPCPMCTGTIINSRIKKVVYGVKDPAAGCCGSLIDLRKYPFSHSFDVIGGIRENECRNLLRDFFEERRKSKSPTEL